MKEKTREILVITTSVAFAFLAACILAFFVIATLKKVKSFTAVQATDKKCVVSQSDGQTIVIGDKVYVLREITTELKKAK